jgi:phage gp36-like protein
MAYCTQPDLETALGGPRVLAQLADYNLDGVADAAVVTDYLESGAAEVRTAVEVKHDPEVITALDSPSLRRLLDANAALSARIAWEKGGKGAAMPEWVRDRAERADKFLDDLAKGFRRLGRVAGGTQAAVTQAKVAGVVDQDPNGDGGLDSSGAPAARISIAGLMRGFR